MLRNSVTLESNPSQLLKFSGLQLFHLEGGHENYLSHRHFIG